MKHPLYTYRPELDFEGVEADKPFNIAPGPNNPVGTVWIEIDKDGYGLHGTPDPARIGKTSSHGCVRLTNWDAEDLATGVSKETDDVHWHRRDVARSERLRRGGVVSEAFQRP